MSGVERRTILRAMFAALAGMAATAIAGHAATGTFTPPVRSRRYQKYGGHNFSPNSTLKDGNRTDRTYNDNGSVYVTGVPNIFNTRVQLPDGAVIEEVQFNYFLGSPPPMYFQLLAFDNANGYQTPIPSALADTPGSGIQTISLSDLPVRVDNATWNYVLRWAPQAADTDHMLWGARIGYRPGQDGP
jgi:hypothetical protein